MATKAVTLADPQSCLNKAQDGEPIFVLRAHDPLASHVVRYWAGLYTMQRGLSAKGADAEECAKAMEDWYKANEMPKPQPLEDTQPVPVLKDVDEVADASAPGPKRFDPSD